MPKTNAEYCRDYRRRRRKNKIKLKTAKSSTERVREFRARRNALLNVRNDISISHNNDLSVKNSESDHNDIPMNISNVQSDALIENDIVNNDCDADWNNSESCKDKDEESILPISIMSPLIIKTSPKSSPPDSPQPYLQQKGKMDDRDLDDEETPERHRMYIELEKEKLYVELEKERIRQRDVELRQRDTALQLQAQWLELAKSGLNILDKYLNDKK
ncbi:uncharacterized protein LOC110999126 [Pieris rapae]|uniref:uncharacterized protein LOC110999126 n=1 Tax=Pieris rapae TaxID=64459 RepID=UPI000B92A652|nr:uncharacterized protein LOC110999126 [Pieris rapae]